MIESLEMERQWSGDLRHATDLARGIAFGEMLDDDVPGIIAEAARLKGVDPPDPDSNEYRELVEMVKTIGEIERHTLRQELGYGGEET